MIEGVSHWVVVVGQVKVEGVVVGGVDRYDFYVSIVPPTLRRLFANQNVHQNPEDDVGDEA